MTRWGAIPQYKIVVDGETLENALGMSIAVTRPENNISSTILAVNDWQSRSYVDLFDCFNALDIYFKYARDSSWTQVFGGMVSTVAPRIGKTGEILEVSGWGAGWGLSRTHCNQSYGTESNNSGFDTPKELLLDIIGNYVNEDFNSGNTTHWSLGTARIDDAHSAFSVIHLDGRYGDNFNLVNFVSDLTTAYAQTLGAPEAGVHWYVSPWTQGSTSYFYFKKIDADHTSGFWDKYYGGSATAATIEVGRDMILYDFRKNIEEYSNDVLLATDFRKPASDYWTEYNATTTDGGSTLWDKEAEGIGVNVTLTDDNGAGNFVVGDYSLLIEGQNGGTTHAFYPASEDASWEFENVEAADSPPRLNFYFMKDTLITEGDTYVRLFTTDHKTDFFEANFCNWHSDPDDEWVHVSIPIGNYWNTVDENRRFRWASNGAPDWNDINGISFKYFNDAGAAWTSLWIDDLHFSGKLIREAKDSTYITATNKNHQRFIRNDVAVDDSLISDDDTGTAGRLAFAELNRRMRTPIVGMIATPGYIDVLPGQWFVIHAGRRPDGTFRINKDFRIKELTHILGGNGFTTQFNLTDDTSNTHAFGVPSRYSLLMDYAGALRHGEARNLKSSGINPLAPRLTKDY